MDDYRKEIADLQAEVARLIEDEGGAHEIVELELQIRVLTALYEQAIGLYDRGRDDGELRARLAMRGYGEWSLDNVYAFVYEAAVDLPEVEPKAFLHDISRTDFAGLLIAS